MEQQCQTARDLQFFSNDKSRYISREKYILVFSGDCFWKFYYWKLFHYVIKDWVQYTQQTTLESFYNGERWQEATSRKSKRKARTEVFVRTNTLSRKIGGQEQITLFIYLKVDKIICALLSIYLNTYSNFFYLIRLTHTYLVLKYLQYFIPLLFHHGNNISDSSAYIQVIYKSRFIFIHIRYLFLFLYFIINYLRRKNISRYGQIQAQNSITNI